MAAAVGTIRCPARRLEQWNSQHRMHASCEWIKKSQPLRLICDSGTGKSPMSNESFGGWTKTFTDPRLCAAILDRWTFNGTIIETDTDCYRLASARERGEAPAQAG